MYLSNIKRIEIESLAFALFLHFLALVLYGVIAIRPPVHNVSRTMVKLNLSALDTSTPLQHTENKQPTQPPALPAAKLQAIAGTKNAGSFITGPVDEIFTAKPPVDIELAEAHPAPLETKTDTKHSPIISEMVNDKAETTKQGYLELLQSTVQQKSNIPAEAAMNGIKGKAVLRLEFNRKGNVTKYSLKTSTGNKMLDNAALAVGARLTKEPFPPAPASFYPNQKLLKFDFGIDYAPANQ